MKTITPSGALGNSAALRLARRLEHIDRSHLPLLAAISASPDDDLPRLVYADWLEERGQFERGYLIRSQCPAAPVGARPSHTPQPRYDDAGDPTLWDRSAADPYRQAERYLAHTYPRGCPLGLRFSDGRLYQWSGDRFVEPWEIRYKLCGWLSDEMRRVYPLELAAWERRGQRKRRPMVRKVTIARIGEMLTQLRIVTWRPGCAGPRDWHLDLMGWDNKIGVARPTAPFRSAYQSRPASPKRSPEEGTSFTRGFAVEGTFRWPPGWTFEQVAVVFARQPLNRVEIVTADMIPARRLGPTSWAIDRNDTHKANPTALPADVFALVAQIAPSNRLTEHCGRPRLVFTSGTEAASCVARVGRLLNDVFRAWVQPEASAVPQVRRERNAPLMPAIA